MKFGPILRLISWPHYCLQGINDLLRVFWWVGSRFGALVSKGLMTGMECSTAWWRLQSKKHTRSVAATLVILSYQTIPVLETLSDVSEGFSMTWVSKYQDTFEILFALNCLFTGLYRTVDDQGVKKTCMAACIDQTFSVTPSSNNFPGEESFNHRHGFCIIVRSCKSNNNLVLISDYFLCSYQEDPYADVS